ncbi:MAG: sensor histidine kinase [Candidatus Eisenbacteria bacterium]|nr:sensor histidine kinase [Candidatus Eisenbacteria bacterium]
MKNEILHRLNERVKELTLLHRAARVLQDDDKPVDAVLREILRLLPPAWQYPEVTEARLRFGDREITTPGFRETPYAQTADFVVRGGGRGRVEVVYREERPPADEGPFLKEERDLIGSLAEMLRVHFQRRAADDALRAAHDDLERQVRERTAELERVVGALRAEIDGHRATREKVEAHRRQLRRLASELVLAEERERRAIAADLHDHVGQALAFIRMRVNEFQGDAVFCGFERSLAEIVTLLDQTIRYTRTLTGEISPPVLHQFGLDAALEWLAGWFREKRGLPVEVRSAGSFEGLSEEMRIMLFKSVRELLFNVRKHAAAERVEVEVRGEGERVTILVRDDGRGFDPSRSGSSDGFGLFSIRERMSQLGGRLEVNSDLGAGTVVRLEAPLRGRGGGGE